MFNTYFFKKTYVLCSLLLTHVNYKVLVFKNVIHFNEMFRLIHLVIDPRLPGERKPYNEK